ncbi:MFS transporter [Candidatus Woesearchaeota archaeon]|nr:MFS transporter [Candidatus Woesearchaeota archaeon]
MNKKVLTWALYDLANTAFTSPFRTIFWPLLVTSFLGGNEFQIGLIVALSILAFSILIPMIGVYSDATRIRRPFILFPTLITVVIIALLPKFSLAWNLVLAGLAIVLYNIALSIYNVYLPEITSDKEMGRVSGIGIGVGFLGTIVSLVLIYSILKYFADGTIETIKGVNAAFLVMAAFFLIFSLPLLITFKDTNTKKAHNHLMKKAFLGVVSTFKGLTKLEGMIPLMIAVFFFANALGAIDVFFFLFAKKEIGISLVGFMFLFMAQSIGAATGAIAFGRLADKIGAKKTLLIGGVLWLIVILMFIISRSLAAFWIAGFLGSLAFGCVLSCARTLFVFLIPKKKMGEFFGYSQILGKLSGLLGPAVSGWIIVSYGYSASLVLVLILVALSVAFLFKTPDARKMIH